MYFERFFESESIKIKEEYLKQKRREKRCELDVEREMINFLLRHVSVEWITSQNHCKQSARFRAPSYHEQQLLCHVHGEGRKKPKQADEEKLIITNFHTASANFQLLNSDN